MTIAIDQATGLESVLEDLIDQGFRAALLWTGSANTAEEIVEEAAAESLQMVTTRETAPRFPILYWRRLLFGCFERDRIPGGAPEAPADLRILGAALRELPLTSRMAVLLELAAELDLEDIGQVLRLPARLVRAALHLGNLELERRGVRVTPAGGIALGH